MGDFKGSQSRTLGSPHSLVPDKGSQVQSGDRKGVRRGKQRGWRGDVSGRTGDGDGETSGGRRYVVVTVSQLRDLISVKDRPREEERLC